MLSISASGFGLLGSEADHLTPYMNYILGIIGFTDIRFVSVNGTSTDNAGSIKKGIEDAIKIAPEFTFNDKN